MAMLEAIENRRAYRALDTKPIAAEILLRLAEAAHSAPSSRNSQPWRLVTVTDEIVLEELKATLSSGNYWAKKAPALVAVVTNNAWGMSLGERNYAPFELGMAAMAYQIQAVYEGLYVHPIAGFNADAAKNVLHIAENDTIMILLVVGYPGDSAHLNEKHMESEKSSRIRLPLEKVHAFNHFDKQMIPGI
ncbi:MAG: nitroreductase family protein [Sphaerochaetaceae bacterium]